jgi:hypothetical protein
VLTEGTGPIVRFVGRAPAVRGSSTPLPTRTDASINHFGVSIWTALPEIQKTLALFTARPT